jgi:NADH:ubiquinone oxidoreductase subunit 4 (subunit M)
VFIQVVFFYFTNVWSLILLCEKHNHEVTIKLEGHNVVDRLNMKYKKFVGGIAMSMVFLKNFLMNLKRESQCNMNTIKNFFFDGIKKIYNVHKNTTSLHFLDDGKYVSRYRMFG